MVNDAPAWEPYSPTIILSHQIFVLFVVNPALSLRRMLPGVTRMPSKRETLLPSPTTSPPGLLTVMPSLPAYIFPSMRESPLSK